MQLLDSIWFELPAYSICLLCICRNLAWCFVPHKSRCSWPMVCCSVHHAATDAVCCFDNMHFSSARLDHPTCVQRCAPGAHGVQLSSLLCMYAHYLCCGSCKLTCRSAARLAHACRSVAHARLSTAAATVSCFVCQAGGVASLTVFGSAACLCSLLDFGRQHLYVQLHVDVYHTACCFPANVPQLLLSAHCDVP